MFDNNDVIGLAFNYDDPNIIANILVNKMEIIQNALAPQKRVQIRTKLAPL